MVDEKTIVRQIYQYTNKDGYKQEEIDSILRYFKIDAQTSMHESYLGKDLFIKISLKLLNDFAVMSISFSFDGNRLGQSEDFERGYDNSVAKRIFAYALNEYLDNHPDFINEVIFHVKDIRESKKEEQKNEFIKEINILSARADDNDVIKDQKLVSLYPSLEIDQNNVIYLSLKVGREKLYVVYSIPSFLNLVNNAEKHRYGRDLEFIHNLSIFDEKSQRLIKLLLNLKYETYVRYLNINENIFEELINIYKGQIISATNTKYKIEKQYLVKLDRKIVKINIDIDYVLSIDNDYDSEDSFTLFGKYIFDMKNHEINVIDCDSIYLELIKKIANNSYPCIEDVVNDFKYNFVLRYPDKFNIAGEIKEEFVLDEILIKAYFDFENKQIYLKEEIYLEDKLVDVNSLNKNLTAQYRKYRSILSSLGFEDNVLKDDSEVINFLSSSLDSLKQYCQVYLSDSIISKSISRFNPPQIKISTNNSMMDVFVEDSIYDDAELLAIISALKKKKKYILYNNQILVLDNKDSRNFLENVTNFHVLEKDKKNRRTTLPIYYAFKMLDDSKGITINEQIRDIFKEIKNFKSNKYSGGDIVGELRKYQLEGVKWLDVLYRNRLNGILADDMGLGKTIEIISFLLGEKIKGNVLIVAPKSLVFNWMNEFMKFAPSMKVKSIYGNAQDREDIIKEISSSKGTIYLTSYDSLRRDEDKYSDILFDTVILDEAQYIKNPRAKKTLSVGNLKCDHRFVLTGTPIENSVLDLWSIFNFLMPNYLPDESEFKHAYESDKDYADKIRKYVAPFILRRNKKDVLNDLPEKYEMIVSCDMSSEQRKIYDAHILLAREKMVSGEAAFDVLPMLTRLRQICIDPSLFVDEYKGGSGKIEELNEIIESKLADGHRILIFSQFVSALDIIARYLNEQTISYFLITGKTAAEERIKYAEEFNSSKKYKIGLVSLKAGGTGLNLVGADVVIHLDPWWNVAAQDQATDRAHRIGQKRNVEVIKLIAENSIEQRVVELQNSKKDLVDKIIAEDDSLITSLSLDDIKYILK